MKTTILIIGAIASTAATLAVAQISNPQPAAPDAPQHDTFELTSNQVTAVLADIGETNANATEVKMIFIRKSNAVRNEAAAARVTYTK